MRACVAGTCAGQIVSHNLQAMQRSSPEGYLAIYARRTTEDNYRLRACSPRKRGLMGPAMGDYQNDGHYYRPLSKG